jgi:hypothetical protein
MNGRHLASQQESNRSEHFIGGEREQKRKNLVLVIDFFSSSFSPFL